MSSFAVAAMMLAAGTLLPAALGMGQAGTRPQGPEPQLAAVADFQQALGTYVELRSKVTARIKPVPNDGTPAEIDDNQRQISQAIVGARAGARPGAIFGPAAQAYIRARLLAEFRRPDGPAVRSSILDENPVGTPVRINGPYPDGIPLSSMPPHVLDVLPKLPEDLEYRFVGDRLILFDNHAHLVIDYIDRALPGL
ncbi:MAG: hypothetical protein ABL986_04535 [Vicinamibacterales bacterium]